MTIKGPQIDVTVTFLEMRRPPERPLRPLPEGCVVTPFDSLDRYLELHCLVGRDWLWSDQIFKPREQLAAEIAPPGASANAITIDGKDAGIIHLGYHSPPDVELCYFGLAQEFTGRGLGGALLDWAIARAWSRNPRRFWLHTCTLDSPAALPTYQKAGFERYKTLYMSQRDPRHDPRWHEAYAAGQVP